jgi:hypothetical protein
MRIPIGISVQQQSQPHERAPAAVTGSTGATDIEQQQAADDQGGNGNGSPVQPAQVVGATDATV